MKDTPAFAYFLTFRTYGSWLHGDERLSVDRVNNKINTNKNKPCAKLHKIMTSNLREPEFILNEQYRKTVLTSIIETCHYDQWNLCAAHVRSNHIHIVLQSTLAKEKVLGKIKCYSTKKLKKDHQELFNRKIFWSRHASTKNIWAPESLFPTLYYVVKEQGEPMALFYDQKYYNPEDEKYYEAYF